MSFVIVHCHLREVVSRVLTCNTCYMYQIMSLFSCVCVVLWDIKVHTQKVVSFVDEDIICIGLHKPSIVLVHDVKVPMTESV